GGDNVCRNCNFSSTAALRGHARGQSPDGSGRDGGEMRKVEAVVLRERVEIVIDAVEEQTGHVGVTVVEAVGHGRQRGITHEYRGRVFESRFLPKALLTFVLADEPPTPPPAARPRRAPRAPPPPLPPGATTGGPALSGRPRSPTSHTTARASRCGAP